MKRLLGMLLVLGVVMGCGSKKAQTPAKPETPAEADRKKSGKIAIISETPDAATVKNHMTPAQLALGDPVVNSVGIVLVPIQPGRLMMGAKTVISRRSQIPVQITKPFYLGAFEVTQGQYEKVIGKTPSHFKGADNLPVEMVSWEEADEFCRKLSASPEERAVGRVYRLPTEAEWEHACRAGTTTDFSFGCDDGQLAEYGWYNQNASLTLHSVGGKRPSAWGLYDMYGNVSEWCWDWHAPPTGGADPTGPATGSDRMYRGGSWRSVALRCQCGIRRWKQPTYRGNRVGFRVALVGWSVKEPSSETKKRSQALSGAHSAQT